MTTPKFKTLTIVTIVTLILWKLSLLLYFPFLPTDGPWTLSHLFSYLDGYEHSSLFAHAFDGPVFKTHVLEAILAPFYKFFPINSYSFILVNFFFVTATISCFYLIFRKHNNGFKLFSIVTFGYLTSTYAYGFRSEGYVLPFLLAIVIFFEHYFYQSDRKKLISFVFIAFFSSVCAFIHPTGGIAAGFIILYYSTFYSRQKVFQYLLIIGILGLVFSFLITQGNVMDYVNKFLYSNENSDHSFTLKLFPKFITLSLGILPLFYLAIRGGHTLKNAIFLMLVIMVLSNFGRSYYFSYLFAILLPMILSSDTLNKVQSLEQKRILQFSLVILFGASLFTHISPTIVTIENPALGKHFRHILNKVDQIGSQINPNTLIWVPSQFGMEIIDQPNARLHHHFYKRMANKKIDLYPNGIMLFHSNSTLKETISQQVSQSQGELIIKELITPVEGPLRIGTLFRQRADSVGLWEVRLK